MSKAPFICRQLGVEDIPAAAQIVYEAFNKMSQEQGLPLIPDAGIVAGRLEEYARDEGIPGRLYGGFQGEKMLGFFMLRKLGIDEESWEINMLSVLPEEQDRGLGTRLLRLAVGEIAALGGVLALAAVTEGNDNVLRLFANEGFLGEASGIPLGDMNIWLLRRDLKKAPETGCSPAKCSGCSGCG